MRRVGAAEQSSCTGSPAPPPNPRPPLHDRAGPVTAAAAPRPQRRLQAPPPPALLSPPASLGQEPPPGPTQHPKTSAPRRRGAGRPLSSLLSPASLPVTSAPGRDGPLKPARQGHRERRYGRHLAPPHREPAHGPAPAPSRKQPRAAAGRYWRAGRAPPRGDGRAGRVGPRALAGPGGRWAGPRLARRRAARPLPQVSAGARRRREPPRPSRRGGGGGRARGAGEGRGRGAGPGRRRSECPWRPRASAGAAAQPALRQGSGVQPLLEQSRGRGACCSARGRGVGEPRRPHPPFPPSPVLPRLGGPRSVPRDEGAVFGASESAVRGCEGRFPAPCLPPPQDAAVAAGAGRLPSGRPATPGVQVSPLGGDAAAVEAAGRGWGGPAPRAMAALPSAPARGARESRGAEAAPAALLSPRGWGGLAFRLVGLLPAVPALPGRSQ